MTKMSSQRLQTLGRDLGAVEKPGRAGQVCEKVAF